MKRILLSILVIGVLLLSACGAPTTAPPAGSPSTPWPREQLEATPETDAKIAELEAKVRELQAENQRLLTENQELSSENQRFVTENRELSDNLARVTSQLKGIQSLVASSSYTQTLSKLPNIQTDASKLATFLQGLPDLPTVPPELTVTRIDDAINHARYLREILKALPRPPPLIAPPAWYELDEMKGEFLSMTEWMENLKDLPDFLKVAGDFDDLRSEMIAYLRDVATTASNTKSVLEEAKSSVR